MAEQWTMTRVHAELEGLSDDQALLWVRSLMLQLPMGMSPRNPQYAFAVGLLGAVLWTLGAVLFELPMYMRVMSFLAAGCFLAAAVYGWRWEKRMWALVEDVRELETSLLASVRKSAEGES